MQCYRMCVCTGCKSRTLSPLEHKGTISPRLAECPLLINVHKINGRDAKRVVKHQIRVKNTTLINTNHFSLHNTSQPYHTIQNTLPSIGKIQCRREDVIETEKATGPPNLKPCHPVGSMPMRRTSPLSFRQFPCVMRLYACSLALMPLVSIFVSHCLLLLKEATPAMVQLFTQYRVFQLPFNFLSYVVLSSYFLEWFLFFAHQILGRPRAKANQLFILCNVLHQPHLSQIPI